MSKLIAQVHWNTEHLEFFRFIPQPQNPSCPNANSEMRKVSIQARFHNIFGKIALIRLE